MADHLELDRGSGCCETLGTDFTRNVITCMGPNTSPRMREVMTALIQHMHDFAREIQLTTDEWMAGVHMINWAGQMSNSRRNEGQLLCDVIGLDLLVDSITQNASTESIRGLTASAVLRPFWRADAPVRENGTTISFETSMNAETVYLYGEVLDGESGEALQGASVDVWQASTNGLYEQQDALQRDHNLCGVFKTDSNGRYSLYCIRPTPYPIPEDGPAGKLLGLMDRHVYRPAHIHLMVRAPGYRTLVTQIFDESSPYLDDDAAFAVKDSLKDRFEPRQGDEMAQLELQYDIRLLKASKIAGRSGED